MPIEIKVNRTLIQQHLSTLSTTANDFKPLKPKIITGENQMNLVEQLNEIKNTYNTIMIQYQQQFKKHILETTESVDTLVETDSTISSNFTLK